MKEFSLENLKLLVTTAVVGVGSAVTYFYFEAAVRHSIDYIWDDLFNTQSHRLLVVPICLVLTLVYFGAQHLLDPKSEKQESHGLGSAPKPTLQNFLKVLGIGFLSLVAGASLGPEAILVPACILVGTYTGSKLYRDDKPIVQVLGMAGFVALFAAFFNSFIVGLLGLLLLKKQFKTSIGVKMLVIAVVASASSILALKVLKGSAYATLPPHTWHINALDVFVLALLGAAGYCTTYAMSAAHGLGKTILKRIAEKQWWAHALLAAVGLSVLYLLGGHLVEFTGNESIVPMLDQAASLGFLGLVWILIVKILAISWSKASGYRGGLVFPTIFVASVLVAIAQVFTHDFNFIYGLIMVIIGALVADKKVKFLV